MTEPKIAPRIVDGEPRCDKGCPVWTRFECGVPKPRDCSRSWSDDPCLPGIRRQRDERTEERDRWHATARQRLLEGAEFKAERDEARRELCQVLYVGHPGSQPHDLAWVAASRDWDYLYEAVTEVAVEGEK